MLDQVRNAAGIHMASLKKSEEAKGEERQVGPDEEDIDISGWTPPPHIMAQWAKAV